MKKSRTSRHAVFMILAVFFFLVCNYQPLGAQKRTEARIARVHDGDTVTLILEGRKYKARLIGIDAPEMGQKPWGKKAKNHLARIVRRTGGNVFVETDIVKFDKYNRLLAYLWTRENEFINERMLEDGYVVLFTIQPNSRYVERFTKAQRIARQEKRGIWGVDGLKERPFDYKKKHPRE